MKSPLFSLLLATVCTLTSLTAWAEDLELATEARASGADSEPIDSATAVATDEHDRPSPASNDFEYDNALFDDPSTEDIATYVFLPAALPRTALERRARRQRALAFSAYAIGGTAIIGLIGGNVSNQRDARVDENGAPLPIETMALAVGAITIATSAFAVPLHYAGNRNLRAGRELHVESYTRVRRDAFHEDILRKRKAGVRRLAAGCALSAVSGAFFGLSVKAASRAQFEDLAPVFFFANGVFIASVGVPLVISGGVRVRRANQLRQWLDAPTPPSALIAPMVYRDGGGLQVLMAF